MSVDFQTMQWIISTFTLNRKVDQHGRYASPLIECVLSFGNKVLENGSPKLNAAGAELWKEYWSKPYSAEIADVQAFLALQAVQGTDPKYLISFPALDSGQLTLDSVIMAMAYPFAVWMVDTGKWVG